VFYMSSAPRPVIVGDQWTHSLTCDTCFLWGPCRRIIRGSRITEKEVQESWAGSTGTRMEHVFSELWRFVEYRLGQRSTEWLKTKQQEDFIVIWSASFCAEMHCQETTSEDGES
jgi:hypothetical protein